LDEIGAAAGAGKVGHANTQRRNQERARTPRREIWAGYGRNDTHIK